MLVRIAGLMALALLIILPAQSDFAASGDHPQNLLAHWTFDELAKNEFADAGGSGLTAHADGGVSTKEGVLGMALMLEGPSAVRVKTSDAFDELPGLTVSSWVMPMELSGYREIFRKEDGDRRILFSFQNDGRILSLGLQTEGTGYQELDAIIDPASLMDRQWHHVAGTYDGRRMVVYLDGLIIGMQKRSGRILSGGPADAFIGSSGGSGEYFQGGIDDLQIFAAALNADEIAQVYEEGLSA
ncbi:MAG: LamG domain-containing protein, partial [Solirubrobacterales bacterium]